MDIYSVSEINPLALLPYVGHRPGDPSGQSASSYEKRFSENYRIYLRSTKAKTDISVSDVDTN